jgi:hypothetical protein
LIEENELVEFHEKIVDIGIKNLYYQNGLFYWTGKLIEIGNGIIKLKSRNGIKIISINEILEIRLSGREL